MKFSEMKYTRPDVEAVKKQLSGMIGELKNALNVDDGRTDKYLFMDRDTTLTCVRQTFDNHKERNRRLAVVFITEDGTQNTPVLAMLTPWDILKDAQ